MIRSPLDDSGKKVFIDKAVARLRTAAAELNALPNELARRRREVVYGRQEEVKIKEGKEGDI